MGQGRDAVEIGQQYRLASGYFKQRQEAESIKKSIIRTLDKRIKELDRKFESAHRRYNMMLPNYIMPRYK